MVKRSTATLARHLFFILVAFILFDLFYNTVESVGTVVSEVRQVIVTPVEKVK